MCSGSQQTIHTAIGALTGNKIKYLRQYRFHLIGMQKQTVKYYW